MQSGPRGVTLAWSEAALLRAGLVMKLRTQFLVLGVLSAASLACTPAAVPLPPDLAQANQHIEIVSTSETFSLKSELHAGDYVLQIVRHERDANKVQAGAIRRARMMSYDLTLLHRGQAAGTAKCVESVAYTGARGNGMMPQDVDDSLNCEGKDASGQGWKLRTGLDEHGNASGFFQAGDSALQITSLAPAGQASKGQIRGFGISDEKGTLMATQRVTPGEPGSLWLRPQATPSEAVMAAALALTIYVPMR